MPDQAVPNYKIVQPRSHVVVPEPETIPPTEDEDSDSETGSRLNVNTGQQQSRATVTQMVFREIQFALEQNWVWRLHILRVKKEMEEGKDKTNDNRGLALGIITGLSAGFATWFVVYQIANSRLFH